MRIVFIGTVKLSASILERLIALGADIAGVITKARSEVNADFADLSGIARDNGIPYRCVANINSEENVKWIRGLKPDIIFCFGFSHILKKEVLDSAPAGVIGFHPARLPENRGRHPIIWALVLGLDKTASTFFFMEESVDSGDILSQMEIDVKYEDNARSLYEKITETALRQVGEFLLRLQNGTFVRMPQDHIRAGYWRRRVQEDGKIDFNKSSREIYNLVRGLSEPYVGAHVGYGDKEIKIWEAKEVVFNFGNHGCGEILKTRNNQILVKCRDNAILLSRHEFEELPKRGEYLT